MLATLRAVRQALANLATSGMGKYVRIAKCSWIGKRPMNCEAGLVAVFGTNKMDYIIDRDVLDMTSLVSPVFFL